MKENEKGFTLIELLAVIVILGLLMAIAMPSVTKYITQSRVKTLVSTMDSYVTAVVNQVNDGEYKFADSTKIYAIPIECVSLEKGGQSPFGNWMQANNNYWAYVLVQYGSENYNYVYGFTFKDDAGYGMYPTINANITNFLVRTGYDDLNKPETGLATSFVSQDKWDGFNVISSTELVVLEAESEGVTGDGKTTCTLCQKGSNYESIEQEKASRLVNLIKKNNPIITVSPTLTTSSNNTSDASGLYVSTATNNGNPTYYFRGNVTNNYVSFAGQIWSIVRINEDGTIRLILNGTINDTKYEYNSSYSNYSYMYYSNSDTAKPMVDNWYESNLKDYESYIATGMFCEQAKTKFLSSFTSGSATMGVYTAYTPNFKCSTDGNGKGIISSKVGLITYDEVVYAGGYYGKSNSSFYLSNGSYPTRTMSPAGFAHRIAGVFRDEGAGVWAFAGSVKISSVTTTLYKLRPVINLNANITATGTGTSSDPYVVQTN